MVDVHADANPTITVMHLGQPLDLLRAADSVHRRVQPQGEQYLGADRRAARPALHRVNRAVLREISKLATNAPTPRALRTSARLSTATDSGSELNNRACSFMEEGSHTNERLATACNVFSQIL